MNWTVLDLILVQNTVKNIVGIMAWDIATTVPMIKNVSKDARQKVSHSKII